MELTEDNLRTLSSYLQQTLSPDNSVRRQAEKFLQSIEGNQGYPILFLNLVNKNDVDLTIRVAGAVTFKNYIKRNWKRDADNGEDTVSPSDRAAIKDLIVELMLQSPEQIQRQLSDAISIIGREDFPAKWPDLLQKMIVKFQSGDFHVINGILYTAHSLFKRYRYEFKSQELWTEIKFVLDNFAKPLTDLFAATMELANVHANNPAALKIIFGSLVTIAKIFYSLNFQDLPEFFEDNMDTWMKHFLTLLTTDNKLLQTQEDEEAGLLEQLKSQICDNIGMYAQKYDEEFRPFLPQFVSAVWNLLVTTGQQVKYDLLVSNAIQFLASVAERPHYKSLFEESNALSSICEKVILPNMHFRESDEELFEDNPEEYIRRDIEGSDVDTRRRAACDLVKALSRLFEAQITSVFSQYVNTMLQTYSNSPKENWKCKNVAVYLVTSLAAKAQTAKHGITQTNELVNIGDFLKDFIMVDLQDTNVNEMPVLKADAIRYVMIFRNQLVREVVLGTVPHLIKLLTAQSQVVHTYAAHAIEKILMMRLPDGTAAFKAQDIHNVSGSLLQNLFNALTLPGSSENEYVMKAIMRTVSTLQEAAIPYLATYLPSLTNVLSQVCKNPSKPHFNHYLFEALTLSIRIVCKSNSSAVSSFEQALFPIFQEILRQDVLEFIPYVFQVLSVLLEQHETSIPGPYMELFSCLLVPALWERPGNIHPLVRLLQAYIERGSVDISSDKLSGLLGVYQKLIASKTYDNEGFYLITSIVEHLNSELVSPFLREIFLLLFQRLQSSKTTKFVKCLLVFFSLYASKFGASALIQIIDSIQPRMFVMIVERLFISDVQKVSGHIERKICCVGIIRLLCEAEVLIKEFFNLWILLLQALIDLIELPEDDSVPEDEHFVEIEDTPGYQTAYSQLVFANKKETDPFEKAVPNVRTHLAVALHQLFAANPDKVASLGAPGGITPNTLKFLHEYFQAANLTLS